jgi:tetratricopeptide (TPR) repeat protein
MMRLYFVTPVWGVNHLRLFLSIGLPSLLAPGNLAGLEEPGRCRFLIYTRASDEAQLKASAVFERLTALMTVEIHRIEEPISNAHRTMSDCHADALRRADDDDAAAVFIPPDCVWSNGSMSRVEQLAKSGKSMIHISGIRLDRDAVVPKLQEYVSKDGCILEIAARPLVALGLAHLHRIAFLHFWKEYPDDGLMPANLYWTVPGEGLALRCFHLHPLLVKSQIKFARFNSTIDDDLALLVCPDHARDHVVTDSDEILAFELSGPERVLSGDFYKNSIDSVAAWMEVGTNIRHHLLARHAIRIHSGAMNETLWQSVERESETVINEVLRIHALPSYIIARQHPGVVLWRYYAMTLGRGRYAGERHRFARFTLRLSRRLVHGNRRIRAIFIDRNELPRAWHPVRLVTRLTARQAPSTGPEQASRLPRVTAAPRMRLIDPIAAAAYQRRGNLKRSFGYLAGAVRDYNKAIDFSPRNTALYFLRGTARLRMGKPQAAAQDFEAALKLDPENQRLQWLLRHVHAARAVADESLFAVSSPLLRGCFFACDGSMRPSHPKWLFYRSFLLTLQDAVRHDDRSVLILAEYGYFSDQLRRRRPGLRVEAILPEELAGFRATGKWDVVIWNGLHRTSREDVSRLLRAYQATGSRLVCITPEPADRLAFEGADEIRILEARGTRLCYRVFHGIDRLRTQMREAAQNSLSTTKFLIHGGQLMLAMASVGGGSVLNGIGHIIDLRSAMSSSQPPALLPTGDPGANPVSVGAPADFGNVAIAAAAEPVTLAPAMARSMNRVEGATKTADRRVGAST